MFDVSYPPQDESNELTRSASADFKLIRMKRFLELEGDIERTSGPDSLSGTANGKLLSPFVPLTL